MLGRFSRITTRRCRVGAQDDCVQAVSCQVPGAKDFLFSLSLPSSPPFLLKGFSLRSIPCAVNKTLKSKTELTFPHFASFRIPSSACNPYLALAATIAAGLDGVERQLECPAPGPPGEGQGAVPALPKTLSEALDRLEEDSVLTEAVGSKLVSYFLFLKREFEVKHFRQVVSEEMGAAETATKEREFYMPLL